MDIFDWKAKSLKQINLLGVFLAICWSAQHPLQGPLYKAIGQGFDGLCEVLMCAELVNIVPYCILFAFGSVRDGTRQIFERNLGHRLLIPPLIGFCGLILYAFGQTRVPGTQVSVILTASPASMLLFVYINHKYKILDAVADAFSSGIVYVHVFLISSIIIISMLTSTESFGVVDWPYATAIFLVPTFYFGAGAYIKSYLADTHHMHLAALAITGLSGTIIYSTALFYYLHSAGHHFHISEAKGSAVVLFVLGGLIAGFFGSLTYNINLRQSEGAQKTISIITHTGPGFAVIIALIASRIAIDLQIAPNYYQVSSAILVVVVLYVFRKLSLRG